MDALVLVAVQGFDEPGRGCVPGELLWPRGWCGRRGCSCGADLHGATSHGNASLARVRRLQGVPRLLVEGILLDALRGHEEITGPASAVRAFLDEVATIEEGRLVRREDGVLLPFPRTARVGGPHEVIVEMDDEP